MGRSTHYKSPAKKLRNMARLLSYFKWKLNSFPNPNLSICHLQAISISPISRQLTSVISSKTDIQPQPQPQPLKIQDFTPKLSMMRTSNTCDTPECRTRRRPCHDGYPSSQLYHDMIGDWVLWFHGHHTQSASWHSVRGIVSLKCVPLYELLV